MEKRYRHLVKEKISHRDSDAFKKITMENAKVDTLDELLHRGRGGKMSKIEFSGPRAKKEE